MISTFERIENEVALTFGFNDFDQLYECGTKDDIYEAMKEVAVRFAKIESDKYDKLRNRLVELKPIITYDNSIVNEENQHEAIAIAKLYFDIEFLK